MVSVDVGDEHKVRLFKEFIHFVLISEVIKKLGVATICTVHEDAMAID
jgi:hypothetical protein